MIHRAKELDAFNRFRASARRMRPTKAHRPALWENMLGTVYAADATGAVTYCDYRYDEALAHIGAHHDVRVYRIPYGYYDLHGLEIPPGKLVWFVIFGASS